MYLILTHDERIHGVDYYKGLEDGTLCGKVHKYQTRKCHPIIVAKKDAQRLFKKEDCIDYCSLSDDEILELGEPVFFFRTEI